MKKVVVISTSLRPGSKQPRAGGAVRQGRRSRGARGGTRHAARQGDTVLRGLPRLPADGRLHLRGRCAGHHGERPQGRRGLLGHTHLLLRDERPDEDPHRPHERDVPQGLPFPRRLPADHRRRGGGRGPPACRERSARLDGLLREMQPQGAPLLRRRGRSERDCRQRKAAGGLYNGKKTFKI